MWVIITIEAVLFLLFGICINLCTEILCLANLLVISDRTPGLSLTSSLIYNTDNYSNALYIGLEVKDKPGVLSEITKKFAKHKISVQRLIQIPNNKNKTASIVIITHKSLERDYQKCIKSFTSNLNIIKNPVLLRLF